MILPFALLAPVALADAPPLAAVLPWSTPARIEEDHGMLRADAGAAGGEVGGVSAGGFVEGAPLSRLAIRVGGGWSETGGGDGAAEEGSDLRLYGGVRGDLLRQESAALNLAAAATYKREGFGGTAGELEATLAASRQFDHLEAGGALTYGHALDRDEGDAELALHATTELGRGFSAGLDMRGRARLGEACEVEPCEGEAADAEEEHDADWSGGAVLAWSHGPAMVMVTPGAQVIVGKDGTQAGAIGLLSVGLGF